MPSFDIQPHDEDAILKEVWNTNAVKAKTELSEAQIQACNKLGTLATIFNSELLREHLNDFMILQKSKERKSMAEFIAAVKAKREDMMNQGKKFFNNMMG